MKNYLLIASVAAMALTAPAQAERGGRKADQQAQAESPRGGGGGQRAERQQVREQRAQARPQQMQRAERAFQPRQQAAERRQARTQRFEQRDAAPRIRQQERIERRARAVETRQARPQLERSARIQEARETRNLERARTRAANRERVETRRIDRVERQRAVAVERQANRSLKRQERLEQRTIARTQQDGNRSSRVERLAADRRAFAGDDTQWRQQMWTRTAERQRGIAELRERRLERMKTGSGQRIVPSLFQVGQTVDRNVWYDDYVPLRYRASFNDDDRYYYRYDGDYLYRLDRDNDVVLSLFPLLGGAYSVGQAMPFYYDSYYNVPLGYSSLYYDTPDYAYRYGDGAIYQVDPTTQLIAGIVALLTGQSLGVGQMLPTGYDVYNVPYAYRSSYYDSDDMWWRYDDGYLYGVDPYSRMIERRVPVYGGYMVGNEWPSYAGYGYDVPDYYDDLYYDTPNYDYRYASGGIYQVDPKTQLIAALAALVTGQNFNVGQRLPMGYDAYNVPFAYRDDYYDRDDAMYRYADGRIFMVDPETRIIRRVILV
jgi:hypothetical protein